MQGELQGSYQRETPLISNMHCLGYSSSSSSSDSDCEEEDESAVVDCATTATKKVNYTCTELIVVYATYMYVHLVYVTTLMHICVENARGSK